MLLLGCGASHEAPIAPVVVGEAAPVIEPAPEPESASQKDAQSEPVESEPARPPFLPSSETSAKCARALAKRLQEGLNTPPKGRPYYLSARDPVFAKKMGWHDDARQVAPGALLPCKRIVAFYGNPNSSKMGVLGEYRPQEMLRRFREQVAAWNRADPAHPVVPAIQLIAVVGQGYAGADGMYRKRMPPEMIEKAYGWAQDSDGILILDVQLGRSNLKGELEYLRPYLLRPDVHLAVDPEFAVGKEGIPGDRVGTMTAKQVNEAADFLSALVEEYELPPKVLVVHRFTKEMVTDVEAIKLRPGVQIVMDMDGWGPPAGKRDTYRDVIVAEPVEYPGFKIFYHHDKSGEGWRTLKPRDLMKFYPLPLYVQYQ